MRGSVLACRSCAFCFVFFFNATATTEIYTLSLHDALPICTDEGRAMAEIVYDEAPNLSGIDFETAGPDRKSTRLNSSHLGTSYAVFCLKKKNHDIQLTLRASKNADASQELMPLGGDKL